MKTDPVCGKSPDRAVVDRIVARAQPAEAQPLRFVPHAARSGGLVFRTDDNSRAWSGRLPAAPC